MPLVIHRPLKIALLGYRSNPFSGGQGIYIQCLSKALVELGHEVDVISGEPYPDLDPNVNLIKLPGLNLFAEESPFRALRWQHLKVPEDLFEWFSMITGGFPEPYTFGERLLRHWRTHRPRYDIVHDNQSLCYALLELQSYGVPIISTIHHPITFDRDISLANCDSFSMRLLIKRWHYFLKMQAHVAKRLAKIVTVSENSKRDIATSFGTSPALIEVVYNGVDTQTFKPKPNITRQANHIITTASADQPLKGAQYLIPAVAELKKSFADLQLTFIGQPKPGGATEQLIAKLGLQKCITFHHGIRATQIADLYAEATLAVVPSEYEGFGFPAAEAMACGVPVVSTDGGALPEVVGDAGITVPKANSTALTEAIQTLLLNEPLRRQLGLAGRARMLDCFDWHQTAQQFTNLYRGMR